MTDFTTTAKIKATSAHASWGALGLDDSKPATQKFLANLPGIGGITIHKVLKQVHPDLEMTEKYAVTVSDLLCYLTKRVLDTALSFPEGNIDSTLPSYFVGDDDNFLILDQRASERSDEECLVCFDKSCDEFTWVPRDEISKHAKGAGALAEFDARDDKEAFKEANVFKMYEKDSDEARELLLGMYNAVIDSRDIQTSTRLLLPEELGKHAVSQGIRAVTKFSTSDYHYSNKVGEERESNLAWLAGLQIPVEIVGHLASRVSSKVGKTCTPGAAVYLSAVIEYISAEILELSGNQCIDFDQKVLCTKHLSLAVNGDEELQKCFGGFFPSTITELRDESTDELDFGPVYDAETHNAGTSERKVYRDKLPVLTSFIEQKCELPEGEVDDFVKRRMEDILRDTITRMEHCRARKVEMRDLVPALLAESRYAGTGIYTLALTTCLENVVPVEADGGAENFSAAWWFAQAKLAEKETLQKAIEVDQKKMVADEAEKKEKTTTLEADAEEEEKKKKDCDAYERILPFSAVHQYVCEVGQDFKTDVSYSAHVVAAIGAAIEEDVSALLAKAAERRKQKEENEQ